MVVTQLPTTQPKTTNNISISPKKYLKMLRLFGFSDIRGDVYLEWAKSLLNANRKRRLILKPRGTFKSSFYTVGYAILRLLQNPNMRIMIAHAVENNAKMYLKQIKDIILRFELFDRGEVWNKTEIEIVTNNKYTKEPSIMVCGARSSITGSHCDLFICDDIVGDDDLSSNAIRESTKQWFKDLENIVQRGTGEILVVGTRWHTEDLYNDIINVINPKIKEDDLKYLIEIETPFKPDGSLRYKQITQGVLDYNLANMDTSFFYSQYMNDPMPNEYAKFKTDTMHFFDINKVIMFNRPNQSISQVLNDESILIKWVVAYSDLGTGRTQDGDYYALCVIGGNDTNYYVLDCIIEKCDDGVWENYIIEAQRKWGFETVVIEDNNRQFLFIKYFKDRLNKDRENGIDRNFSIRGVTVTANKQARIESLVTPIKVGTIRFRQDYNLIYPLLIKQLTYFPVGHDDAPDALEGTYQLAVRRNKTGIISF